MCGYQAEQESGGSFQALCSVVGAVSEVFPLSVPLG